MRFLCGLLISSFCLIIAIGRNGMGVAGQVAPTSFNLIGLTTDKSMISMQDTTSAYGISNPSVAITLTSIADSEENIILDQLWSGALDFAIAAPPTAAQQASHISTLSLPIAILGMVFPFNLPSSAGSTLLQLSPLSIFRIFTGNITNWSDPALVSENPQLTLPNHDIVIVLKLAVGAGTLYGTMWRAFSKISPSFVPPPIVNDAVVLSQYNFRHFYEAPGTLTGVASVVVKTEYSIGISMQLGADLIGANVAAVLNTANEPILATPQALTTAAIELGMAPMSSGVYAGTDFDLTMPQSRYAYPFCAYYYLIIDQVYTRSTCATGSQLMQFLLWIYTASVPATIGVSDDMVIIPSQVQTALGIQNVLTTQVSCNGSPLIVSAKATIKIQGTGINGFLFGLLVDFYGEIDSQYAYTFAHAPVDRTLLQLADGEIDLAVLSTANVNPKLSPDSGVIALPLWATAVAPYVNLPSFNQQLVLDVDTVAQIFLGMIVSWADDAILSNNPLFAAFLRNMTNGAPDINVIVCCSSSTDLLHAGNLFAESLMTFINRPGSRSKLANNAIAHTVLTNPVDWQALSSLSNTTSFTIISTESRLSATVDNTPFSIGYSFLTTATGNPLTFPAIKQTSVQGDTTISHATTSDIAVCGSLAFPSVPWGSVTASNLLNAQTNLVQVDNDALFQLADTSVMSSIGNSNCFPFTSVVSLVVLAQYVDNGDGCARANRSLSFVQWLINNSQLTHTTNINGVARLSLFPQYLKPLQNAIVSIWCGTSDTILAHQPVVWTISSGINYFTLSAGSIGIICTGVSLVLLVHYRHRPVFKSSSISMLSLILIGLSFLYGSVIAYATSPVTVQSCANWFWLLNIGFCLTFSPLFIKTWRIYSIFNRKALKVVKISDIYLLLAVLVHLSFDILVLMISQLTSSVRAMSYTQNDGVRDHIFTECSTDQAGLGPIIVLAVEKGLLLLFGAVMAFSTRRVASTFNESSQVAWAIYNVTFSVLIVIPIILWTGAKGDTLILLAVFLTLWITFVTHALMFALKIHQLGSNEEDTFSIQSGRSVSGGFSFISIIALSDEQVVRYLAALETHVIAVRKRVTAVKQRQREVGGTGLAAGASAEGGGGGGGGGGVGAAYRSSSALSVSNRRPPAILSSSSSLMLTSPSGSRPLQPALGHPLQPQSKHNNKKPTTIVGFAAADDINLNARRISHPNASVHASPSLVVVQPCSTGNGRGHDRADSAPVSARDSAPGSAPGSGSNSPLLAHADGSEHAHDHEHDHELHMHVGDCTVGSEHASSRVPFNLTSPIIVHKL